ncbi:MAG: helicase HerA-like domain-containing protein, partial [Gemmatimonadales bacterium]
MPKSFSDALQAGYGFEEPAVVLGAAMLKAETHPDPKVRVPLSMMNRHGLVCGATGTGKTKTLQLLAEQLSVQGVPVFVADIKGDLSGMAAAGTPGQRIDERAKSVGWAWQPTAFPVEFVSLTGKL